MLGLDIDILFIWTYIFYILF